MIDIIFHDETGIAPCLPGQMGGFENTDGDGEIHYYRLFDGVGIMLLRLEMESYTEIRTQAGVLEINFCINGRFETSFSMRDRVLLKPGDMAVLRWLSRQQIGILFSSGILRGDLSGGRPGGGQQLDHTERSGVPR